MTPAEKLLSRVIVTSGLDSARWARFEAGLRDRAYFAAKIESVRWLATGRDRIGRLLEGGRSADGTRFQRRDMIIDELGRIAREEGIATGTGGLTDPGAAKRIGLVADMQAGFAQGYADWESGLDEGAQNQFPAQELIRIESRAAPRDWRGIWLANGGTLTEDGRMVALKTDAIWTRISRFGLPWPPFDYGSGMGLRDVSRADAIALGLIDEGWRAPERSAEDFNRGLRAKVRLQGEDDPLWRSVREAFGDQVVYEGGEVRWEGEALRGRLAAAASGRVSEALSLGRPTPEAAERAAGAGLRLDGGALRVDTGRLARALERHGEGRESREGFVPLSPADLELLPLAWRYPDAAYAPDAARDGIALQKAVSDGWLNALVSPGEGGWDLRTVWKSAEIGAQP